MLPCEHDSRIEYLLQFYNIEQIEAHCGSSEEKLAALFEACQPREYSIEELWDVNNGETYYCDSPDGWVPVEMWRNKGAKDVVRVQTGDGLEVEASHDHLFQKYTGEWIYARDLVTGTELLTVGGMQPVSSVEETGRKTVYDLAIGHQNHRYFTSGFSSHNSGKSLVLQNLALNWVLAGYNVIYFSLELAEDRTSLKLDAMLTGRATREVMRQISDSALMVKMKAKKAGQLYIKKYPGGGTTCNDFRAYLKEFEISTGVRADAIIIDYLDLMHPVSKGIDLSNLFIKDKYVSEEIRALMHDTNAFGATASQLTRCLSIDSVLVCEDGRSIAIKDVRVGDQLQGSSGYVTVLGKFATGRQNAYRIRTASGKTIVCSANHRFPTQRGLLSLETGLVAGDVLRSKQRDGTDDAFVPDAIVSVIEIDAKDMIDIEVSGDHLFVADGILTHNSSIEAMGEFDQSHTAGGISKMNTADTAIALYAPPQFKERGEFEFVFLKTRESTGVGLRLKLGYDNTCMRITNRELTVRDVDKPATYDELRKELLDKMEPGEPPAKPAPEPASSTRPTLDLAAKKMGRYNDLLAKRRTS